MGKHFISWQLYTILWIMCLFYGLIASSTTEQPLDSSTDSASTSTNVNNSFFHQEKKSWFNTTTSSSFPAYTRPFNSSSKVGNNKYNTTFVSDTLNATIEDKTFNATVTDNLLPTPDLDTVTNSINTTVLSSGEPDSTLEHFKTEKSEQYRTTESSNSSMLESQTASPDTNNGMQGEHFYLNFASINGSCFKNFTDNTIARKIEEHFRGTMNLTLSVVSSNCRNNSLEVVVLSINNLKIVFNNNNLSIYIIYLGTKYNLLFYKLMESRDVTTLATSDFGSNSISMVSKDIVHTTGKSSEENVGEDKFSDSDHSFWHKLSELERILIIVGGVLGISLLLFILILSCHTLRYRKHTQSFNLGKTSLHIEVGPQDYVLEKLERPKILYNLDGSIVYESTGNMDPPVPNPSPCFNHQLRYSSQKEDQRLHRSRLELTQDIDEFDNESTLSQLERKLMLKDLKSHMNGIDNPVFVKDDPALPSESKNENNPDVDTQSNDSGVDGSSIGSSLRKNSKGKL